MPEIITVLLVLLTSIAAGFFDSIVGAGGLISVPSLVFLGLPPHVAIATDRLGTIGHGLAALLKFWRAKILNTDTEILQKVVGFLLIILLPLIFLKQSMGVQRNKVNIYRKTAGLGLYFLIMIFGGFFGQGTGSLIFMRLFISPGFTMIEVLATGAIPWFVLSLSSLLIFALNGIVDYTNGIVLLIGMAIGGYAGAHAALKRVTRGLSAYSL